MYWTHLNSASAKNNRTMFRLQKNNCFLIQTEVTVRKKTEERWQTLGGSSSFGHVMKNSQWEPGIMGVEGTIKNNRVTGSHLRILHFNEWHLFWFQNSWKSNFFRNALFFFVFERLTRPETVHAEAALRENSSTSRDDTLEPTTDKMRVRAQNWTSVLHLLPWGLKVRVKGQIKFNSPALWC